MEQVLEQYGIGLLALLEGGIVLRMFLEVLESVTAF